MESYGKFLSECKNDDLFLYIVQTDKEIHPVLSDVSIIFCYNFRTKNYYCININHPDDIPDATLPVFVDALYKANGRIFVLDKKSFTQLTSYKHVWDLNLGLHLSNDSIIESQLFDTEAHKFIYGTKSGFKKLNNVVPLVKHIEVFEKIVEKINKENKNSIYKEDYYLKINSEIIEPLTELEINGIYVDKDKFQSHFDTDVENYTYSQYNVYTSTGRPSNRFGGINYAGLNKEDGSRECFISRFGLSGTMVLIDYAAFHPRIIGQLTQFKLPSDENFYEYMAKLFFKKKTSTKDEVMESKLLIFRQLYGGVEDKYSHIPYFYNLKGFIESYWEQFTTNGLVRTPMFGRKIYNNQVNEATPNKLLNYILQATETEIAIPILGKINEILRDKKSKAVLYTYDSLLFDVYLEELELIKTEIVRTMECHNSYPIKFYIGNSYASLKQISV